MPWGTPGGKSESDRSVDYYTLLGKINAFQTQLAKLWELRGGVRKFTFEELEVAAVRLEEINRLLGSAAGAASVFGDAIDPITPPS